MHTTTAHYVRQAVGRDGNGCSTPIFPSCMLGSSCAKKERAGPSKKWLTADVLG